MISETQVIYALSNEKSLVLFDLIAFEGGDRENIINCLSITRKQYHSRISALRRSGLVEKTNGTYFLTSFGKVVHQARQLIGSGVKVYWKLNAIDAIQHEIPEKRHNEIVESLIDNQEIRELLSRNVPPVPAKPEK
jgi:hypothetical protein